MTRNQQHTTRRGLIETLLALGAATALQGSLDSAAWRAYEALESAWIRDRHHLLVSQSRGVAGAAQLDLELKLAELQRRGMQFRHLLKVRPQSLRGGIWQLASLPWTDKDIAELSANDPDYGRRDRYIRGLTEALRQHPDYELWRQAQARLWKSAEYRDLHRRYTDRMAELQNRYAGASPAAAFTAAR